MRQTTIARAVEFAGVGLHSGKLVRMRLLPADVNTGIRFRRVGVDAPYEVAATAAKVTATLRATTIANADAPDRSFYTIEHLMSALCATEVDNCVVELDACEPPVADGASAAFVDLINEAGVVALYEDRRVLAVDRVLRVDDGGRFVMVVPYDGLRVSFTSVNPHRLVGTQYLDLEVTPEAYRREIAPARTIAYEDEINGLRKMGLGLGGTLENVIVYNDERWLNDLRFADEFVRHKILDVLGDLRLAGAVRGHVIAVCGAHALNTRLAKLIHEAYGRS